MAIEHPGHVPHRNSPGHLVDQLSHLTPGEKRNLIGGALAIALAGGGAVAIAKNPSLLRNALDAMRAKLSSLNAPPGGHPTSKATATAKSTPTEAPTVEPTLDVQSAERTIDQIPSWQDIPQTEGIRREIAQATISSQGLTVAQMSEQLAIQFSGHNPQVQVPLYFPADGSINTYNANGRPDDSKELWQAKINKMLSSLPAVDRAKITNEKLVEDLGRTQNPQVIINIELDAADGSKYSQVVAPDGRARWVRLNPNRTTDQLTLRGEWRQIEYAQPAPATIVSPSVTGTKQAFSDTVAVSKTPDVTYTLTVVPPVQNTATPIVPASTATIPVPATSEATTVTAAATSTPVLKVSPTSWWNKIPTITPTGESVESQPVTKAAVEDFVNAMKNAGQPISSTQEILAKGLDITVINGIKVASINGYPVMVEEGGKWGAATLRQFGRILGIEIGTDLRTYMTSNNGGKEYLDDFNFGFIDLATYNNGNEKRTIDNEVLPQAPQIKTLLLHGVIYPGQSYPVELNSAINSQDVQKTKDLLKKYIIDTMDRFPNINAMNLINESRVPVREDDKLMKLLGENYIIDAYRVARVHAKETGRDIKLLFSETANHYPGEYTNSTLYFSKKLAAEGLIDGVAVQGHLLLNQWIPDIDKEGMKRIFANYPVPVWITEADVNLTLIGGSDQQRSQKLAKEYINLLGACVESGNCKAASFFNGWDSRSWLENGSIDSGGPNADGTLYSGTDLNHVKRLAWWEIIKLLYGYAQNIKK